MRIPLDYYRILGLPTQATPDQVQQAHRDRVLQLPRREYSEPAIAARRELLDEAYSVLSEDSERQKYDARFLQQSATVAKAGRDAVETAQVPHITIEDHQLIGALLLLQELGEYEQVLKLGDECLTKSKSLKATAADVDLISADVALTVALAHLELGREQWQQSNYERAASSLEEGQDLLLREGLFAGVRGEIRSDLYRLRPYRVLELVSQPLESTEQREKGIQILRDMLQERNGIDGHGDDQSGLSVDDFLRFVQQLRDYLTVEEQQELFETESRRPSAVASYLGVYALMARGFADHQPALVRRAKTLLGSLSKRQDVHLEQSVCALMLGQTEEANHVLEFSQEFEPLAFIRENSQGSPDLLPGLCLYAERWLQEEVFPNFRDLKGQEATLKSYFANPHVQNYLETLPAEIASEEWQAAPGAEAAPSPRTDYVEAAPAAGLVGGYGATTATLAAPPEQLTETDYSNGNGNGGGGRRRGAAAGLVAGAAATAAAGIAAFGSQGDGDIDEGEGPGNRRQRRRRRTASAGGASRRGRGNRSSLKLGRILLLAGGALLALWILFSLLGKVFGWVGSWGKDSNSNTNAVTTNVTKLDKDQLAISLNEPVLAEFQSIGTLSQVSASGTLDSATAEKVIRLWLGTKVDVFSKEYEFEKLPNVLTGDALAFWEGESELSKEDGITVQYEHKLAIDEVTPSDDPNQAEVLATVTEIAKYYQGGSVVNIRDDRDLPLRYDLIQEDGAWKIQSMGVR